MSSVTINDLGMQ